MTWRAVVFCGVIVPKFALMEEGGVVLAAAEGHLRYDTHDVLFTGSQEAVEAFCSTWNEQPKTCEVCPGGRLVCLPVSPENKDVVLTVEAALGMVTHFQNVPAILSPATN